MIFKEDSNNKNDLCKTRIERKEQALASFQKEGLGFSGGALSTPSSVTGSFPLLLGVLLPALLHANARDEG